MNIMMREVYHTNADGDRFFYYPETYVRGSTIKFIRVPDKLLDEVKEEQNKARESNRGARGVPGGGRGGRGAPTRGMSSDLIREFNLTRVSTGGRGIARGGSTRGGPRGRGRGM
jgi:U6 snRNA-associated Sm-like protein LSm4